MIVFDTVDARDAIVEAVIGIWQGSEYVDTPIQGVNGPKENLDTLHSVINYEIEFRDSEQVTIGSNPIDRTWGFIEFHFGVREGTGIRKALKMQSYFKHHLKAKHFKSVKTLIPSPGKQVQAPGWVFETLYVPFYFDSLPAAFKSP